MYILFFLVCVYIYIYIYHIYIHTYVYLYLSKLYIYIYIYYISMCGGKTGQPTYIPTVDDDPATPWHRTQVMPGAKVGRLWPLWPQ
jgi:hypothetical protein